MKPTKKNAGHTDWAYFAQSKCTLNINNCSFSILQNECDNKSQQKPIPKKKK